MQRAYQFIYKNIFIYVMTLLLNMLFIYIIFNLFSTIDTLYTL